ncbi:MAG TPA: hypothetical protein VLC95_17025, partial [Anaerolineae bacterium]|nr:hypothetical protein [Anaerolineae bacterium]
METRSRRRSLWLPIAAAAIVLLVGGAVAGFLALRATEARHYQAAGEAYAAGEWDRALNAYSAALSVYPPFVRQHTTLCYANRGASFFHLGQYERAVADLDLALSRQADLAPALAYRGVARLLTGDAQAAREDLDLALDLDPGQGLASAGRAWMCRETGDAAAALADAEDAVVRAGQLPAGFLAPAYALKAEAALSDGDMDGALGAADAALAEPERAGLAQSADRALAHT